MANNMPRQLYALDGLNRCFVARESFGNEKRCPKADIENSPVFLVDGQ
jgi:hypothetical protein